MDPKSYHLESGIDLEEPPVSGETGGPALTEAEPLRESIDTVRQLLDSWKQEYDQTESGERKSELAYQIVKMGEALTAATLNADEVKIRETEPGVLGFYVPSTGEIAITPAGLSLPAEHFKDVLVHEATHAGKMTGKRISDEGLAQLQTRQRVGGAMHGIYETEQKQASQTFARVGVSRVLEEYDFDRPAELIQLYLETEWQDAWKNQWSAKIGNDPTIKTEGGRKELLQGEMKDWSEKLEKDFKDAAPRLLEKAEPEGFDFFKAHQKVFQEIVEDKLGQ